MPIYNPQEYIGPGGELTTAQEASLVELISAGLPIDDEIPTGVIDDSNKVFTLANAPITGSVKLYLGGVKLEVTTHYSISGKTITLTFAPSTGEVLLADYRK